MYSDKCLIAQKHSLALRNMTKSSYSPQTYHGTIIQKYNFDKCTKHTWVRGLK